MDELILKECIGFEWDHGNQNKNQIKHTVSRTECEQVFFNQPLLLNEDAKHSEQEKRQFVLGKTDDERKLFIAFTVRNKLIRIISARTMSKRERDIYEKIEEDSEI